MEKHEFLQIREAIQAALDLLGTLAAPGLTPQDPDDVQGAAVAATAADVVGSPGHTDKRLAGRLNESIELLGREIQHHVAHEWNLEKPTLPGVYWIRGGSLEKPAPAIVLRQGGGLWLHIYHGNEAQRHAVGGSTFEVGEWWGPAPDPGA